MVSEVRRAAALVRWAKPGARAQHSEALKGRTLNLSVEQHEQNRINSKRLWEDPEFRAKIVAANTTHGMKGTPTYSSWKTMRQRCLNPRHPKYPAYGGRGITIDESWELGNVWMGGYGQDATTFGAGSLALINDLRRIPTAFIFFGYAPVTRCAVSVINNNEPDGD